MFTFQSVTGVSEQEQGPFQPIWVLPKFDRVIFLVQDCTCTSYQVDPFLTILMCNQECVGAILTNFSHYFRQADCQPQAKPDGWLLTDILNHVCAKFASELRGDNDPTEHGLHYYLANEAFGQTRLSPAQLEQALAAP